MEIFYDSVLFIVYKIYLLYICFIFLFFDLQGCKFGIDDEVEFYLII